MACTKIEMDDYVNAEDDVTAIVQFDSRYYKEYLTLVDNRDNKFKSNGSIVSMKDSRPWHDWKIKRKDMLEFYHYFANGEIYIDSRVSFSERKNKRVI
jgi:CMP-N-acetylneuraminic acid synthetase